MSDEVAKWLDACPLPVVARIIENPRDLHYIMASAHAYEPNVLVVIDLHRMQQAQDTAGAN
jgi:hypothetical protein